MSRNGHDDAVETRVRGVESGINRERAQQTAVASCREDQKGGYSVLLEILLEKSCGRRR
jgi:hypothetical protein